MQKVKKFLFRNKWHVFPFFFKKRILNFKRSKWKPITSKLLTIMRRYFKLKKRLISLKYCRFLKNVQRLKKFFKQLRFQYRSKFFIFFKNLKKFLISKKFKKLKRSLKFKLSLLFKKPFYQKYKYYQRCFKSFFFNYTTFKVSAKRYIRTRFFFKTRLLFKASILKYYFNCLTIKFFKALVCKKYYLKDLAITFVSPELHLDILLWRLKIFKSPYLAKYAFQNKKIIVTSFLGNQANFCKYKYRHMLQHGDVLSLAKKVFYSYKKNLNSCVSSFYLPTFLEFDYYANNIIILKDLDLNFKDLNSILKEPLNIYQFRNFFR